MSRAAIKPKRFCRGSLEPRHDAALCRAGDPDPGDCALIPKGAEIGPAGFWSVTAPHAVGAAGDRHPAAVV